MNTQYSAKVQTVCVILCERFSVFFVYSVFFSRIWSGRDSAVKRRCHVLPFTNQVLATFESNVMPVWGCLLMLPYYCQSNLIKPCQFKLPSSLMFVPSVTLLFRQPLIWLGLASLLLPCLQAQFSWLFIKMIKRIVFYWACTSIMVICISWKGWPSGCLYTKCKNVALFFPHKWVDCWRWWSYII